MSEKPMPDELSRDLAADLRYIEKVAAAMKQADRPDLLPEFWGIGDHGWPIAIRRALAAEAERELLRSKAELFDRLFEATKAMHLHRDDGNPTVEALLDWVQRGKAAEAEVARLRAACQYAAVTFAQVPRTETVPPIVLHDCRDKLEEALQPPNV